MMYNYYGFGPLEIVLHVAGWVIVIWLIIWIVRSIFGHPHHGHGRRQWMNADQSMNILRERFAKGEITKEEFDKMRKDLE